MSIPKHQSPFPPINTADKDGMLLVDDDLSEDRLVEAYRSGIFPWPIVDGPLEVVTWWSPDPRAILPLDELHISRRLSRRIRNGQFRVTLDTHFEGVIHGCAEPRRDETGTWITPALSQAYESLHRSGIAHSVEVWDGDELVGGVYGVSLGGFFAAESMFHRRRDASKIALVYLVDQLCRREFRLLDIQQWSPHMGRLGAQEVPRATFLHQLDQAVRLDVSFDRGVGSGQTLPIPTSVQSSSRD